MRACLLSLFVDARQQAADPSRIRKATIFSRSLSVKW